MIINEIHNYSQLVRQTLPNGIRYYVEPNGNQVASVTTILSATSDTTQLTKWRQRVGDKEADRIRDEATSLGTLMHEHLERFVCGLSRPKGNNHIRILASNMADQIIERGLVNVNEVWGLEVSLFYPGLYAGTSDLCGVHKGENAIIDYKTANKMKTRQMIEDYFLQLAAYIMCHNNQFDSKIQKGTIFMVDRNLNFQEFVLEGSDLDQATERWLNRLQLYYALQKLAA